ncbi:hypothetical protein [Paenibacillus sp. FSL E2-0190]|uniref:hypothetical protein n=1 Tax=Paenibacillus sp. FSL E2-0190 TaxID=2954504 RepID=UPI0030EC055A
MDNMIYSRGGIVSESGLIMIGNGDPEIVVPLSSFESVERRVANTMKIEVDIETFIADGMKDLQLDKKVFEVEFDRVSERMAEQRKNMNDRKKGTR